MSVEISHHLFIDHSQYYQGCAWPTCLGVGLSPHEALDDACEMAIQQIDNNPFLTSGDAAVIREAVVAYPNDEPDEPGELAEIEGWDQDFAEVYWHCELSIKGGYES